MVKGGGEKLRIEWCRHVHTSRANTGKKKNPHTSLCFGIAERAERTAGLKVPCTPK